MASIRIVANNKLGVQKLCFAGILIAVGVVGSMFSFPVFGAKCAPIQHIVNIIAGVTLGPVYAVVMAFITALLRNLFGLGTLLAFPGSMVGAFCCGVLFQLAKKLTAKRQNKGGFIGFVPLLSAFIGETVGTGVLGGMLACPVAILFGINPDAAIFSFVFPFLVSTVVGSAIALLFLTALRATKATKTIALLAPLQ